MSKIAFIFPGQGAQTTGMGQDFYQETETGREMFEKASEILGFSMTDLCFDPAQTDRLNITEYTQPAMVTASLAMMRVFMERTGIRPDVAAGLSLGEYPAMAAAGVMSDEDAIRTVRQRGILMQGEVPVGQGAMSAVLAMDAEKIEEVIAPIEGVQIANYNCPGQIVISGKTEAVAEAGEKLKEAGAKRVLPLKVSGPFHSKMLVGAGEKLGKVLDTVEIHTPEIPYIANVTADYVTNAADVKPLLMKQVSSSVRWEQTIRKMLADGVDTFIEIGTGKTLTGFMLNNHHGKMGSILWSFANGYDDSPVKLENTHAPIKSVGNSTTTPKDLVCDEDVKIVLYILAESVAARLRENGFRCRVVEISVRDNELFTCQLVQCRKYHKQLL